MKYELLQDWKTPFRIILKGKIWTKEEWYKEAEIHPEQLRGLPAWFRAVQEYKVGDFVITGNCINQILRNQLWEIISNDRKEYVTAKSSQISSAKLSIDDISPAPPLPEAPIMYDGKEYRVKMQNGVPEYREAEYFDYVYNGVSVLKKTTLWKTDTKYYILEPVKPPKKEYAFINTVGEIVVTKELEKESALTNKRKAIGNYFEAGNLNEAGVRDIMRSTYILIRKAIKK